MRSRPLPPHRRGHRSGFTLVEVILATVVGIVALAGAAYLYGQAQLDAGDSRALEKVAALQQLIEEYASANNGQYPDPYDLFVLYTERRTDLDISPWGGSLPAGYLPPSAQSTTPQTNATESAYGIGQVATASFGATQVQRPGYAGELGYFQFATPASVSVYDWGIASPSWVTGYAVWDQGRDGNEIDTTGGKP